MEKKSRNSQVVLVGHSLGGMIIRAYAIKYPGKVAGLIFVDPSHEDYNFLTQEEEDALVQLYIDAGLEGSIAAKEAEQLVENIAYLSTLSTLPDVPTVVLTSMKLDAEHDTADKQVWYNAHARLGEGVTNFKQITTNNSGHYIMLEEPWLVLDAIREIVEK